MQDSLKKRWDRKKPSSQSISPVSNMKLKLSKTLIILDHIRNPQPTSITIELENNLVTSTDIQTELIQ